LNRRYPGGARNLPRVGTRQQAPSSILGLVAKKAKDIFASILGNSEDEIEFDKENLEMSPY
jgi:hypothetical protein